MIQSLSADSNHVLSTLKDYISCSRSRNQCKACFDHIHDIHVFNCYSVKQFIVQKQTKMSILYRDIQAAQVSLQTIEDFIVIGLVLSLNFEVLCKRDVRSQDQDETEMRPRRWSIETKTFEKTPRDCLETETFETKTTTLHSGSLVLLQTH